MYNAKAKASTAHKLQGVIVSTLQIQIHFMMVLDFVEYLTLCSIRKFENAFCKI